MGIRNIDALKPTLQWDKANEIEVFESYFWRSEKVKETRTQKIIREKSPRKRPTWVFEMSARRKVWRRTEARIHSISLTLEPSIFPGAGIVSVTPVDPEEHKHHVHIPFFKD